MNEHEYTNMAALNRKLLNTYLSDQMSEAFDSTAYKGNKSNWQDARSAFILLPTP